MPIYEYKCRTCSNEFELRRGFSDDIDASCPTCQGQAERLFSPVPILFKGPGFYVTDYNGKPNNALNCEQNAGSAKKENELAATG